MRSHKQNEQNKKSRKGKKIMMILGVLAAVIAGLMLIGAILHATYYSSKYARIQPYGQMVPVEDGFMHVYSMGTGEETVVLLPGMGVPLPSADFGPLMRTLSENFTVVCVEYFGQGFSSQTNRPRTSANYVEEIRTALSKAGFSTPVTLMAHSISSIYAEYYAATYPQEVKAIISLDGTTTALYAKAPAIMKFVLPIASFQQAIGTTAILGPLTLNRKEALGKGYTEKELSDMASFAGFFINKTLLEQIANSAEFIKQTMDLPYPAQIPYFKVISKQTYETPNSQLKKFNLTPQEYQTKHLERIGAQAQFEILEGSHFIYVDNVQRIAEIAKKLVLGR